MRKAVFVLLLLGVFGAHPLLAQAPPEGSGWGMTGSGATCRSN
jgi:hypothetical protein